MSPPPPPPPVTRRDWTLPIIAGVVAVILFVLAVCVIGGAAAFVSLRRDTAPTSAPTAVPEPSTKPAQPDAEPGPQCLIGDWLLTNTTSTAEIYGTTVQLSGKGSIVRYSTDGTYVSVNENVVLSGTAGGSFYEVIFNGSLKTNYVADAEKILYSNPTTTGTTTWKINGKVRTSEQITAVIEPYTYKCQGNELRTFRDKSASEYQRILPPGVPV